MTFVYMFANNALLEDDVSVRVGIREQKMNKRSKATTKPLMAILDITRPLLYIANRRLSTKIQDTWGLYIHTLTNIHMSGSPIFYST